MASYNILFKNYFQADVGCVDVGCVMQVCDAGGENREG